MVNTNGPTNQKAVMKVIHNPIVIRGIACLLLYYLFCRPILIVGFQIPGPYGPPVKTVLSNGDLIHLQCRRVGRESEEILFYSPNHGPEKEFVINAIHALDMWYAKIRERPDGNGIWVESGGVVVCSLDLKTGQFQGEGHTVFWATPGEGKLIAQGWCRTWWEIISPI